MNSFPTQDVLTSVKNLVKFLEPDCSPFLARDEPLTSYIDKPNGIGDHWYGLLIFIEGCSGINTQEDLLSHLRTFKMALAQCQEITLSSLYPRMFDMIDDVITLIEKEA